MTSTDSILTPEIRAMIGKETRPVSALEPISQGDHRRYTEAIMSDSPVWYDEEYAKKTIYGAGRVPASMTLRVVSGFKTPLGKPDPLRKKGPDDDARPDESQEAVIRIPYPPGIGPFHGGDEVEYFQPPKIGDRITLVSRVTNIVEKTGRSGKILVVYIDRIYTNQNGELICINHHFEVARRLHGEAWKKDDKKNGH
jgi:acyl dehydratase